MNNSLRLAIVVPIIDETWGGSGSILRLANYVPGKHVYICERAEQASQNRLTAEGHLVIVNPSGGNWSHIRANRLSLSKIATRAYFAYQDWRWRNQNNVLLRQYSNLVTVCESVSASNCDLVIAPSYYFNQWSIEVQGILSPV